MLFDVQYENKKVIEGYRLAEEVLQSSGFYELLMNVEKYTYTSLSPEVVRRRLVDTVVILPQTVRVKSYYRPSKAVIATTGRKQDPEAIFVNRYNINRSSEVTYFLNGIHEWTHKPMGFRHGTNYPPGSWRGWILGDREDKNLSVSHTFERLAKQYAESRGLI